MQVPGAGQEMCERCVSRVYLIELPRRLRMDWRARREPQSPEMRRLWRLRGCGAWMRSHVESKSLEGRSYQDADLAFLECTYDGFDVCVMVIDASCVYPDGRSSRFNYLAAASLQANLHHPSTTTNPYAGLHIARHFA